MCESVRHNVKRHNEMISCLQKSVEPLQMQQLQMYTHIGVLIGDQRP